MVIACATIFILPYLSIREAIAADPREILAGKDVYAVGICGFKEGQFKTFAGNGLVAPKNVFDRFERCALFVNDKTLNPAWIALMNKNGELKEIIKWDDPSIFERVWITGTEI